MDRNRKPGDIILTLRPLRDLDGVPVEVRLKQLMKVALRRFRLNPVWYEFVPEEKKEESNG